MNLKSFKVYFFFGVTLVAAAAGVYLGSAGRPFVTQVERKTASESSPPSCQFDYFDRANLLAISQGNSIKSIVDVLKGAPNCFKQNQVAIYHSDSLHCANYRAPRIILYSGLDDSSHTVCSFNSGVKDDYAEYYRVTPNADCHEDTLECETFNPTTNRFEFFEVKDGTKTGKSRLTVSRVNPPQCMSCHRGVDYLGAPNPRPNLETYPAWPGFYGSMHDKLNATPQEKERYFADYARYKSQNARYSVLPEVLTSEGNYKRDENPKPIVNLHNLLSEQNFKRVAAGLTHPDVLKRIWPFRYAILGALACNDDIGIEDFYHRRAPARRQFPIESFLPGSLSAGASLSYSKMASQSLRSHLQTMRKMMELQRQQGVVTFEQFVHEYDTDIVNDPDRDFQSYNLYFQDDFWNAVRLGYIAENLGISTADWSMTFGQTMDFAAGAHNLKNLLKLLAPWLLDGSQDQDMKLSLEAYLGESPDATQCEILRNKSLKALADVGSWTGSGISAPSGEIRITPPQTLGRCLGCHVNGNAPAIPFHDPLLLKQALGNQASIRRESTLFDDLLRRVESGNMPPNSALSGEAKAELKNYFTRLRE